MRNTAKTTALPFFAMSASLQPQRAALLLDMKWLAVSFRCRKMRRALVENQAANWRCVPRFRRGTCWPDILLGDPLAPPASEDRGPAPTPRTQSPIRHREEALGRDSLAADSAPQLSCDIPVWSSHDGKFSAVAAGRQTQSRRKRRTRSGKRDGRWVISSVA